MLKVSLTFSAGSVRVSQLMDSGKMAVVNVYIDSDLDEWTAYAVSRDGLHWRDLSPTPVLRSRIGDPGVRDPFPVRDPRTGRVYLIATDLCIEGGTDWGKAQFAGSRDIIVWESDDLIRWSGERAETEEALEALIEETPEMAGEEMKNLVAGLIEEGKAQNSLTPEVTEKLQMIQRVLSK